MTLQVNGRNVVTPKPETEEYNVQSFIYSRQRPFHPRRLFALLYDKFILQLEQLDGEDDEEDDDEEDEDEDEDENMEEDAEMMDYDEVKSMNSTDESDKEGSTRSTESSNSTARTVPSPQPSHSKPDTAKEDSMAVDPLDMPENDVILANKRAHPTLSRLFRSKGEFLLATRPHRAGDWSQAGAMLTMTGGRPWFCTLPTEEYFTGDEEVDKLVQHDIQKGGEWGDRRQELVFIGEKLDHASLETMLDACLLNDKEFEDWQKVMRDTSIKANDKRVEVLQDMFEDGFPDWGGDEEEDDHEGHDHAHGHGGGLRSISKALKEVD